MDKTGLGYVLKNLYLDMKREHPAGLLLAVLLILGPLGLFGPVWLQLIIAVIMILVIWDYAPMVFGLLKGTRR